MFAPDGGLLDGQQIRVVDLGILQVHRHREKDDADRSDDGRKGEGHAHTVVSGADEKHPAGQAAEGEIGPTRVPVSGALFLEFAGGGGTIELVNLGDAGSGLPAELEVGND